MASVPRHEPARPEIDEPLDEDRLWDLFCLGDEGGIRLEMVEGMPIWEASPGVRHQAIILQAAAALMHEHKQTDGCGCHPHFDIYVRFPDGSYKRPDLAIYCEQIELVEKATWVVPDAVVEVISRGYAKKDVDIGAPFYLKHGVKDVVLVNPPANSARHLTQSESTEHKFPGKVKLSIGCLIDLSG